MDPIVLNGQLREESYKPVRDRRLRNGEGHAEPSPTKVLQFLPGVHMS